jgi:hypothetical protein
MKLAARNAVEPATNFMIDEEGAGARGERGGEGAGWGAGGGGEWRGWLWVCAARCEPING